MKVIIFGNYGNGNAGDEVILVSVLQDFRHAYSQVEFVVVSGNPPATTYTHGVRAIARKFSLKVIRAIAEADLVVIGGGGVLIDEFLSNFKYSLVIWTALLLKKPVLIYAIGLDTITNPIGRFFLQQSLNRVTLIILRDEESKSAMEGLGVTRPPIYVTADSVFSLDSGNSAERGSFCEAQGINTQKGPYVGISLWLKDSFHRYDRLREVFAKLADYLVAEYSFNVVFIVNSITEYEGDLQDSFKVWQMAKNRDRMVVVGENLSPLQLLDIYRKMDLVIGMRYHSLVFAAMMNVPVIGIERSKYPKNGYFLKQIGQVSAGFAESLSFEQLRKQVKEVWEKREEIKIELAERVSRLRVQAMKNRELIKNWLC